MVEQAARNHPHPWLRHYPEDIPWHAELPIETVPAIFDAAVARFGERPFLDFLGRRHGFAETGQIVERLAQGLMAEGVGPGVRVGLMLPNCPYYVFAYYAVLKAGGIVVNVNPLLARPEIELMVRDSGMRLLITVDLARLCGKIEGLVGTGALERIVVASFAGALPFAKGLLFRHLKRRELATLSDEPTLLRWEALLQDGPRRAYPAIDPDSVAVLQYTGGTTGVPKAAELTHAGLACNARQMVTWCPDIVPGEERILAVLPFFHIFAMTGILNVGLLIGGEIVMLPRFELAQVLSTIRRKKPSLFPVVPTILSAINAVEKLRPEHFASLRYMISGGAPLPREVQETFERRTHCQVVEGYGLTEASPTVCCNPFGRPGKPGSIGLPLPRTIVEIVDMEDRRTVLPPGEIGEICVRGPQVMRGYHERPEETARALQDGRLHTGDLGIMDEDGYVFVVDRLKEMIINGGYKVYPRNIEEVLYAHPDVLEAAVIGVPDPVRGQVPKAFVVRREAGVLDEDELRTYLAERLSAYELPRLIEFRDELPKTPIGKIQKKELSTEERQEETVS